MEAPLRQLRHLGFVLALFVYFGGGSARILAIPEYCSVLCGPTASCDDACTYGGTITCGTYPTEPGYFVCDSLSDGVCNESQGESCEYDPNECGECPDSPTCGNDECELGESHGSCPQDCPEIAYDPGNPPPPDRECSNGEPSDSVDCEITWDACIGPEDCPEYNYPTLFDCINRRCVARTAAPGWAVTCDGWEDCQPGWTCTNKTAYGGGNEKVCLPLWYAWDLPPWSG